MEYPVYILGMHPHPLFEGLGWVAGAFTMMLVRRRYGDPLSDEKRVQVALAALLGAIIGAKMLAWLEHPYTTWEGLTESPALLIGGKTVVGGLLGGMMAVELAKNRLGITVRTGDAWVLPLAVGMSIGRLGCFFTGLDDMTYGYHTSVLWGVDFGDGKRHPTQLYEMLAIWLLVAYIHRTKEQAQGSAFRSYMVGYLWWRLFIDWLKPTDAPILTLSAIQIACIVGLLWYHVWGRIEPVDRLNIEGASALCDE